MQDLDELIKELKSIRSSEVSMFPCTQCGICCNSLAQSATYQELDRGDGTCLHFNEQNGLCSIYETRPLLCRIDDMYEGFFAKEMSKMQYITANIMLCYQAQAAHGVPMDNRIKVINTVSGD
jgi:Fe-S-cluster containining protein